jgi:alanyl-tRNA synthetase
LGETERLYYNKDCPSQSFALVLWIESSGPTTDLILDSTIFYPEGGGQPWDLGSIDGIPLISVTEKEGRVLHRLDGRTELKVGDRVSLLLDSRRRRDHSQQHSAQHLMSAILERAHGIHTLSFHLGAAASTIDISCPEPDSPIFEEVEALAESFIAEDRSFRIHTCPPEDLTDFDLRKKPPAGEAELRIVEIDGYDWVPCCGTHVSSCAELRLVKILSTEKYKGNTRLSFVAGDRAVAELGSRFSSLKAIAGLVGSSAAEAPGRVETLIKASRIRESELENLVRDRARLEVDAALARSAANPAMPRVLSFSYDDRSAEAAFETAKSGVARNLPVVVLSKQERTVAVLLPQRLSASEAAPTLASSLKPLLGAFPGAKGGGGPYSFRASFASVEDAEAFAAASIAKLE